MGSTGARLFWTVFVVVGLAVSLGACATTDAPTFIAVSDVKSLAGKWAGLAVGPGSNQQDYIEMTIREDGSYDVLTRRTVGTLRGNGTIVIREGRIIMQGGKGRGVGSLMGERGERVMKVDVTFPDNIDMSATLRPTR
jgi:hypothetical protein